MYKIIFCNKPSYNINIRKIDISFKLFKVHCGKSTNATQIHENILSD